MKENRHLTQEGASRGRLPLVPRVAPPGLEKIRKIKTVINKGRE